MSVRCGIVGSPNAGKSTLFNALTHADVPAENFPFCTVDPNTGSVAVPDSRLQQIAGVVAVDKTVPVTLDFVDIAGLVAGASRGEGLGNRFLAHIREMDVIAHVVSCFSSQSDWQSEIAVVNLELMLADLATVTRAFEKFSRLTRTGDQEARAAVRVLTQVKQSLERAQPVSEIELTADEQQRLKPLQLLSGKRKFYVLNVNEADLESDVYRGLQDQGDTAVVICAALECELAKMSQDEQEAFRLNWAMIVLRSTALLMQTTRYSI